MRAVWWTEGVPEGVRVKCAERAEREGNKLPKAAYLDLLDLKRITESRWSLFSDLLEEVGWTGGRKQSLRWLEELNEIRRLVAHASKRHFGQVHIGEDQLSFLDDTYGRVKKLRAA